MFKKFKKLFKKNFVKNVFVVASGAAGAQMISLILSPIVTRIYGPEAFGVLGTFTSLTQIIIPISALTFPVAIVLPKRDDNAISVVKLSTFVALFVSFSSLITLFLFKDLIISIFNLEKINFLIYLVPIVILLAGIMQVAEQWVIRTEQFSINAKSNFLHSLISNLSKVGIGLVYPFASVLVIIQAITQGIRAFLIMILIKRSNYTRTAKDKNEKKLTIKDTAKQYYDFPLYRAPEELFSTLSQNLPVLLLTIFFGPSSAGFYNIGRTVLSMPSRLIGKAIGDVFYPRISKAKNRGEDLSKLIKRATLLLAGIGIIPYGLIIVFGPFIFSLVFGEDWATAGEYARWIALLSFSTFLNKPAVKSMPVLSAQRFHLLFTIFRSVTRSLALVIGFTVFKNDLVAVQLFGVTSFITNLMLVFFTLKLCKKIHFKTNVN